MSNKNVTFKHEADGREMSAVEGTPLWDALVSEPQWEAVKGGKEAKEASETPKADKKVGDDGSALEGVVDPEALKDLPRQRLNELAGEKGIPDADTLPNKGAVIDAIVEASETTEG